MSDLTLKCDVCTQKILSSDLYLHVKLHQVIWILSVSNVLTDGFSRNYLHYKISLRNTESHKSGLNAAAVSLSVAKS